MTRLSVSAVVVVSALFTAAAAGCGGNASGTDASPAIEPSPAANTGFSSSSPDERFIAISGTSDHDIWAVGWRDASPRWVLRHFDGASWSLTTADAPGLPFGVWARSPDDAWAVGSNGAALHWQGMRWDVIDTSAILTPGTPASPCTAGCSGPQTSLASVFSVAPDDVWAVGYAFTGTPSNTNPALVVHYDGKTWTRSTVDAPDGLFRVWGSASNDVWAAGAQGITFHWDGMQWSRVDAGTSLYRLGLWGSAKDDVWAVGNGGMVTRFDGRAWSRISDEGITQFDAVSGSAANNVWAVGSFQRSPTASAPLVTGRAVGHWDGSHWATCKAAKSRSLKDLWVSPTGRVWGLDNGIGGGVVELPSTLPSQCEP